VKFFIFLFILPIFCFAQLKPKQIDSLFIDDSRQIRNTYSIQRQIQWSNQLVEASQRAGYLKGEVLGYTNLASIYRRNFKLRESLNYLYKAECKSNALHDDFAKGRLYIEFAQVFYRMGLYQIAIRYCDMGISYFSKMKPDLLYRKSLRYAFRFRGICYQVHDPRKALDNLQQAAQLDPTPIVFSNIAFHYIKFEYNVDSARLYLKKSFDLLEEPTFKESAYHRMFVLQANGEFLMKSGRYSQAIVDLNKSIELAHDRGDLNFNMTVYRSLGKAYNLMGDHEKESVVKAQIKALEDTLYQLRSNVLAISVGKLYDDNKSIKAYADKQLIWLSLLVVLLLSCLIFVSVQLLGYQKRLARKRALIQEKELANIKLVQQARKSDNTLSNLAKENSPEFLVIFQEVYPEFCERLRTMDPTMNNETLKFCALLRLNFSSKEIARYTHREVRSIQTRKNRLRKQLGISSEVDLNVFMYELSLI
jgi:tetratricopeptide (TPR) repeat protein